MPRGFATWLILICACLFLILAFLNGFIVATCFIGTFMQGYFHGFDDVVVFMLYVFSALLLGDLAVFLYFNPAIALKSTGVVNIMIAVTRFFYLILAGLLFYGLFWDGSLGKYYWTYLTVATSFTVVNLPWMIFHLILCVPKYRRYLSEEAK